MDTFAAHPRHADYHASRGLALAALYRLDDALASFDAAIRRDPDDAAAWNNRGNVLQALRRPREALASFEAALRLTPHEPVIHSNRGNVLLELKRVDEALASYEQALHLNPDDLTAQGMAMHARSLLCQWDAHDLRVQALTCALAAGHAGVKPFTLLALVDDPALHRQASQVWIQACHPARKPPHPFFPPSPRPPRSPRPRLHVAYLSADFHDHPTSHLIAQLLELHDRSRVEVTGISWGPDTRDALRARVSAACDRFVDVRARSDQEVAGLCRDLGVDIAVDLKGFTADSRSGLFAERCAPLQINWLGYPATSGAAFMDYIVADRTVIAPEDVAHYSEKVIWLPHTYQPNDGKRQIATTAYSRAACGLPEHGVVFCCFNKNYKIQPAAWEVWMRILDRVPGSVLWLFEDTPSAAAHLRQEAAARGIDPARLVFARRLPLPEHLARHRVADLFLDTWPYNAHTTASDALWAGLPLLTLRGASFAARVAASLLNALDVPELITHSPADYESLAVALARDPQRLQGLRAKLAAHRLTQPLFDCARFTRNLETAYHLAMARHLSGMAPDHLQVT